MNGNSSQEMRRTEFCTIDRCSVAAGSVLGPFHQRGRSSLFIGSFRSGRPVTNYQPTERLYNEVKTRSIFIKRSRRIFF